MNKLHNRVAAACLGSVGFLAELICSSSVSNGSGSQAVLFPVNASRFWFQAAFVRARSCTCTCTVNTTVGNYMRATVVSIIHAHALMLYRACDGRESACGFYESYCPQTDVVTMQRDTLHNCGRVHVPATSPGAHAELPNLLIVG